MKAHRLWVAHFFVVSLFCLFSPMAHALVQIPALSSPVIDDARMLTVDERSELIQNLKRVFESGGPQMQFWSVAGLEGEDIPALAIRAADVWKLGRQQKDDGVILILAPQERKTRLEIGRGLEGSIPDALAARLLRNVLRPALQKQKAFEGVTEVFWQVSLLASPDQELAAKALQESSEEKGGFPLAPVFILGAFILLLLVRMSPGGRALALSGIWMAGSGGGQRGRGGSGWGGGGGGFSGGGSSGDW